MAEYDAMIDQLFDGEYATSQEAGNEVKEEDLFDSGDYRMQPVVYTKANPSEKSLLFGKPVTRIQFKVFLDSGKARTYFANACPEIVKGGTGRIHEASKIFYGLAEATGTTGRDARETLRVAKESMFLVNLGKLAGQGDFGPRNIINRIKLLKD